MCLNGLLSFQAIVSVVKSACKGIVCDLVILIEGRQEDELPERIIGSTRYVHQHVALFVCSRIRRLMAHFLRRVRSIDGRACP